MSAQHLPEGWQLRRIGDSLKLQNGYPFKPSQWSSAGDPIIRIQNLNSDAAEYNYFSGALPEKFRARSGDLLFAWSGTPGTSFGAHVWTGPDAWINQHIFRVDFRRDEFDRDFLRLALTFNLGEYVAEAQGGVGLAHITKAQLNESLLVAPPLSEQQLIAKLMTTSDGLAFRCVDRLAGARRTISRLRQAILAAACCGKLTVEWRQDRPQTDADGVSVDELRARRAAESRRRNLEPELNAYATSDGLPATWSLLPLGLVLREVKYGTAKKSDYEVDGSPVLRIPNVSGPRFDTTDLKYTRLGERELSDLSLQAGDLLMIRSNGSVELVGKTTLVPEDGLGMAFAGYLLRLRPDLTVVDPRYLALALASPALRVQIEMPARSTSGVHNINTEEVRALGVPLPPMAEQREIVLRALQLLATAETIQARLETAARAVRRSSHAILARAFSGAAVADASHE